MNCIRFLQLNCNRRPHVNSLLEVDMQLDKFDIMLLQEPAANNNKVYFNKAVCSNIIYSKEDQRPRTCIIVNKKLKGNIFIVSQLVNNDMVTIRVKIKESNGNWLNLLVCCIYLHDSLTPEDIRNRLRPVIDYANSEGLKLILAGDFNSHHPLWGGSPTDHRIRRRGEAVFDFICDHNLEVLNDGRSTYRKTSINGFYESTIDLTLTNHLTGDLISEWNTIDDCYYGSDHVPITFSLERVKNHGQKIRNIRKIDVEQYRNVIRKFFPRSFLIRSPEELNACANRATDLLMFALENSCPLVYTSKSFSKPWYTVELDNMRKQVWKANAKIDEAIKNNEDPALIDQLHEIYKESKKIYEEKMEIEKQESFQSFASDIESVDEVSRLTNIAKRIDAHQNITMCKSNNQFSANSDETLELLVNHHFPNVENNLNITQNPHRIEEEEAREIENKINSELIEELVYEFESYKAPGLDEIHPIMLKCVIDIIAPALTDIIKYCLKTGLSPDNWLKSKVIFIPKPGKSNYETPKSFRPICLMTFLLKLIEKVIVRLMGETITNLNPMQYAYRKSMSTIQALNDFSHVISKRIVKRTMKANKTTYASFIDIEGAFDKPKLHRLKTILSNYGIKKYIINWIMNMNSNRIIQAEFCDSKKRIKPLQGFAQGGVLSCYLWIIYVNGLVEKLNAIKDIKAFFFSDDIAIVSTARGDITSQRSLQIALDTLQNWCDENELTISTEKCTHMRFSRKRQFPDCNVTFYDQPITFSDEVKYLGVIFDKQWKFRKHLEYIKLKVTRYSWRLKTFIGNRWGINLKNTKWAYNAIIIPKISYAASIFIHTTDQKVNRRILQKAQNNAIRSMSCAIRTTPNLALRAAFGIISIDRELKISATMELIRLHNLNQWEPSANDMARCWAETNLEITKHAMNCDWTKQEKTPEINTVFTSVEGWRNGEIAVDGVPAYTDASVDRVNNRTGIGIYAPLLGIIFSGYSAITMSSYKGELIAINKFLSLCIAKDIRNTMVSLITDSLSAIKALENSNCRSNILVGIKRLLAELQLRGVHVSFLWIPSHTNYGGEHFQGNDRADELSRDINAVPCSVISNAPLTRKEIKANLYEKFKNEEEWPLGTHITSKAFRMDEMIKDNVDLTGYSRRDFSLLLRFYSGFSCLAQHMKYVLDLDHETQTYCRFCMQRDKTDSSVHIIEDCPRFNSSRLRIFDKSTLKLEEERLANDDVLKFIVDNHSLSLRLMTWTNTIEEANEIIEENSNFRNLTLTQRMQIRQARTASSLRPSYQVHGY